MTSKPTWTLPAPPREPDVEWQSVIRVGRVVPFGHAQDEDDEDLLIPIPNELNALEKAKLLLKEYSLREVADWLSRETGRVISHEGLRKRLRIESKRQRDAQNARQLAERYKAAWAKAEKLEKARLGGRKLKRIEC